MKGTGKAWLIIAASIVVYILLGMVAARHIGLITWLGRIGVYGEPLAAAGFLAVWTWCGLRGPYKWWRTDIGITLGLFDLAVLVRSADVAYAELFTGGSISTLFSQWIYIGTLLLAMGIIAWRTAVFLSVRRDGRSDDESGHGAQPASPPAAGDPPQAGNGCTTAMASRSQPAA